MNTNRSRRLTIVAAIGCLMLSLSACFPDNIAVYDGPLQVEFRPTSATLDLADETTYRANVQLIGPHQTRALSINFAIDDASTAIEGVHFTVEGNGSTQIPANSSFAEIVVHALPEGFDDGARRTVVITLHGNPAEEVVPAGNYRTLTLRIDP